MNPLLESVIMSVLAQLPWLLMLVLMSVAMFIVMRNLPKLLVVQKVFSGLHPMFVDALLLTVSAFLTAVLTYMSTEEAYKYVHPIVLFWMKVSIGSSSSAIQALVAFRNKQFADYIKKNETTPATP